MYILVSEHETLEDVLGRPRPMARASAGSPAARFPSPGDRERWALGRAEAVVVDATTWCAIVAHAERLGLSVPPTEPVTV